MKVLLLGNGFDLFHHFPTRYIDFLSVVNFLIENYNSNFKNVGQVLGNQQLHLMNNLTNQVI